MVVLVDDGDGARVQVDPEEVGPHLHAALQLVALLDSRPSAVDRVHTHWTCWQEEFGDGADSHSERRFDVSYLSKEAGSGTDLPGPASGPSEDHQHTDFSNRT